MDFPGRDFKANKTVEWFPDMATAYKVTKSRKRRESEFESGKWNGNIGSESQREHLVINGWDEGAKKIEPMFDAAKLATINTQGTKVRFDVAGFTPSVPRFVAGNPMNMRRRVKAVSSKAPLTIVVDISSSAGISPDYMLKRGTGIACLVMYLSIFRAVDLYVTAAMQPEDGDYYFPCIKIGTSPFDLKALAWAICHPGCARSMIYAMLNEPRNCIPAACINGKQTHGMEGKALEDLVKPVLGLKDEDIYFARVSLEQPKEYANPEQWARDYIKKHFDMTV